VEIELIFSLIIKHSFFDPTNSIIVAITPMENEYDFIEIETHGKRSDVLIKKQGERALRSFGLDDTEVEIEYPSQGFTQLVQPL